MKTIKRADDLWKLAEFCADSIYNYQNSEHSDKSVLINPWLVNYQSAVFL